MPELFRPCDGPRNFYLPCPLKLYIRHSWIQVVPPKVETPFRKAETICRYRLKPPHFIEVFVRLKEFLFDWRQEVLFDFAAQSEERLFAVGEIPLVELELEEGVFAKEVRHLQKRGFALFPFNKHNG